MLGEGKPPPESSLSRVSQTFDLEILFTTSSFSLIFTQNSLHVVSFSSKCCFYLKCHNHQPASSNKKQKLSYELLTISATVNNWQKEIFSLTLDAFSADTNCCIISAPQKRRKIVCVWEKKFDFSLFL